jgi:glycosyltransferase involved in cell wall biosynthesis
MNKITFVIPSRNNLEFLQLAYTSIRNLKTKHCILILDDASTDGTSEWIKSLNDLDIIHYHNPGPERIGIVGMFDKGIEMSNTDVIFAFHADMVASPNLDTNILKYLKSRTVVCATRIEPPLHPSGPEKIIQNWGNEVEEFDFNTSINLMKHFEQQYKDKTTEGIFAPWCMYKSDYLAIGGHDELFAPQSKEDSDLFNRFVLKGYKVIQSWDGLVYHFTSRGSRFNKYAGGKTGENSPEWQYTNMKNTRNFIRKWGHFVKHDALMKPIIPPKYNISFILKNGGEPLVKILEPWCDRIYTDCYFSDYVEKEQLNTKFDLSKRVLTIDINDPFSENDIVVEIDGYSFDQQDYTTIQQLSEIIKDSGSIGTFEIGNLKITINSLNEYQNNLIYL